MLDVAESKVRYDSQREKYEKMIENMRKKIEDLEIKCVCVCVCVLYVLNPVLLLIFIWDIS